MASLKNSIKKVLPKFIRSILLDYKDSRKLKELNQLSHLPCNTSNLHGGAGFSIDEIFSKQEINSFWDSSHNELEGVQLLEFAEGVNPGDRRAIYYLISYFKPQRILEIGTHIGASTLHICRAMEDQGLFSSKVVTVDIVDVNDPDNGPWVKHGAPYSPQSLVQKLAPHISVEFISNDSFTYFDNVEDKYDFIFLDGDHSATTVYQELPRALNHLNEKGVILLHDYFPEGKMLWRGRRPIKGPFLGVNRHIKDGADMQVIPLGDLPWPTRLNTNTTSLALVFKKSK